MGVHHGCIRRCRWAVLQMSDSTVHAPKFISANLRCGRDLPLCAASYKAESRLHLLVQHSVERVALTWRGERQLVAHTTASNHDS